MSSNQHISSACLYLHGFNSSPQSLKVQLLSQAIADHDWPVALYAPDGHAEPVAYMAHCAEKIGLWLQAGLNVGVIGSSLGGFYARHLAEKFSLRAALINPALRPWLSGRRFLGQHVHPSSGEVFTVSEQDVLSLESLAVRVRDPKRYLLLLQKDDAVVDYQSVLQQMPDSPKIVRSGTGHAFTDFDQVITDVFSFLKMST
jgi:predicted esterase YcpF (UPF0227 family)